jgi:tetratricopeptide (TPR) repeat protein
MRADPAEPLSYFNLGNLYLRAGRAADAQAEYGRATTADPALVPAWFNLARARAAAGDLDGALAAVERGLEFAPEDEAGVGMRRELMEMRGARPPGSAR